MALAHIASCDWRTPLCMRPVPSRSLRSPPLPLISHVGARGHLWLLVTLVLLVLWWQISEESELFLLYTSQRVDLPCDSDGACCVFLGIRGMLEIGLCSVRDGLGGCGPLKSNHRSSDGSKCECLACGWEERTQGEVTREGDVTAPFKSFKSHPLEHGADWRYLKSNRERRLLNTKKNNAEGVSLGVSFRAAIISSNPGSTSLAVWPWTNYSTPLSPAASSAKWGWQWASGNAPSVGTGS